jgi:hypothetical protein
MVSRTKTAAETQGPCRCAHERTHTENPRACKWFEQERRKRKRLDWRLHRLHAHHHGVGTSYTAKRELTIGRLISGRVDARLVRQWHERIVQHVVGDAASLRDPLRLVE